MTRLNGKVVAVTGAAGGIGQALCRALAAKGCRLGLLSRTEAKLRPLADELAGAGTPTSAQLADLRQPEAVRAALGAVQGDLGPIDVLIHNAGVGRPTSSQAPNLDHLEEMLEVNYLGGMHAVAAVLPSMIGRGSGHLVAVSSLSALRGMAWTAGYSASKAALGTCLESLRPALRRRGIAVSTCYMGFVRTALTDSLPMRFPLWMLRPEAAARRILRTIGRGRREAYFPWYYAWGARLLRRLPAWAFDAVMSNAGRFALRGEY
jgi:short-subunit dehydrogenase